jgi:hypothetical protein
LIRRKWKIGFSRENKVGLASKDSTLSDALKKMKIKMPTRINHRQRDLNYLILGLWLGAGVCLYGIVGLAAAES